MPVNEVHYFRIECDDCALLHPYEDDNAQDVIDAATEDGWAVPQNERESALSVLCPKCAGLARAALLMRTPTVDEQRDLLDTAPETVL